MRLAGPPVSKKRLGRPRITDQHLHMRISKEDHDKLLAIQEARGHKTVSDTVRDLIKRARA